MIVTSAVRHAAAGSAAVLFVLPVPAATASPVTSAPTVASAAAFREPTPPVRQYVDPARLNRKGTQVQPLPGAPGVPEVSALSWVVADASSGEVLAARNAHRKLPPASTLKALFALTALPYQEPSAQHTVADSELTGIGDGSSLVGVKEGYTYKVSDLWNGVFLSSGNDAVHVLAAMNGGWESMSRRMQEKARSLGAMDTHVVSPDGYDAPGQVSSAYDLAVFGRAGLQDPAFTKYCSTAYADFPAGSWSYGIANTNRLLTGADGVARYPGLIGIKNGYTSNAGNTLISAARRGDRTLVVSVMNPQGGGGLAVYEEARDLLDWGFAAAGRVQPVGSLLPVRTKAAGSAARAVSVTREGPAGRDGRAAGAAPRAGSEPAAGGDARVAAPSGASAGLPLALVGSACAAALALWALRRRAARRAG
ncbi:MULTISPECIES: D-alanyl-D-alanine carboxypeptidase family protein [Streptomyces]|uniref:D-alanyl-D-alanine carboxypeptidase n=1 Tax=Streptomyces venezuelae (strain ATCC 10712 / CBS 650.69 / DSM 40230 / JCM 4526 / NBRC 13096 / PD 04745) TaxID=953739 RepID=F2R719_STRVP|nr:D-alanyl-D-alanine carboxypeptidase [Streptomyces venezuelae]APE19892.1 D-alanyl-D-alanine carboxypeptidase [Streptomyces venezuelae]QER97301.1 D-alanyl-D-alanine carboxypeptidase [Streptomyces venezuelae ATCC 10712]CCA53711.1 D-alanyl-D-alanine carboxypeptidase [Streptomyces venezuelae ATCC 10712]